MLNISNEAMERKKLVAKASSALTDAMMSFTEANDGLTPLEWIKAANESIVARCLAEGLREEWGIQE